MRWRRTSNSLEEFIAELCDTGDETLKVRRSALYVEYRQWCAENGRKPFAKGKVRELLEHNIVLGVRLTNLDGYEVFRGIALKHGDTVPTL
jgi:putative DNA primase/helicase